MMPEGFRERMNNIMIVIGNNIYIMPNHTPELDLADEEDRRTLPDRIKEAIEDYGAVDFDRETADKFFHATWDEFRDAVVELLKDGFTIKAYIEKENEDE